MHQHIVNGLNEAQHPFALSTACMPTVYIVHNFLGKLLEPEFVQLILSCENAHSFNALLDGAYQTLLS